MKTKEELLIDANGYKNTIISMYPKYKEKTDELYQYLVNCAYHPICTDANLKDKLINFFRECEELIKSKPDIKLGQTPAFASSAFGDGEGIVQEGMSKRLYIATMAMQGLIQAGFISANSNAKQAFIMADHLLAKESYTSEELKDLSKDGRL